MGFWGVTRPIQATVLAEDMGSIQAKGKGYASKGGLQLCNLPILRVDYGCQPENPIPHNRAPHREAMARGQMRVEVTAQATQRGS